MASSTEICNLALLHLGTSKSVASLTLTPGTTADHCRRLFPFARNQILRDLNWPFATAFEALELVKECPTTEWRFQYQYPVNCSFFRRVASGTRNDSLQTLIPYRLYRDPVNGGKSIYTDMIDAFGEFTFKAKDEDEYDDDFSMGMSYRLAYLLAPVITKNDVQNIQAQMIQLYNLEISIAGANAMNEQQDDLPRPSEIIRARAGFDVSLRGDDATDTFFPANFEVE